MFDLFKQRGTIHLEGEGVSTDLPLAPAIVLFGPNDAGKTNLLRQMRGLFLGNAPEPRDAFHRLDHPPDDAGEMEPGKGWNAVWLDLDLERVDHQEFLLHVAGSGEMQDGESVATFLLPFEFMEEDRLDYRVKLGESLLGALEVDVPEAGEPDPTAEYFVAFLNALLRHRAEETDGGNPAPESVDTEARLEVGREQAALHVSWPDADGLLLPEYVWFMATKAFAGAVRVTEIDEADEEAVVEQFRRYVLQRPPKFLAAGASIEEAVAWTRRFELLRDPWLDKDGRVAPEVVAAAAEISSKATDLAPPFLSREYAIEIQPLSPMWWGANRDQRLRLALLPRGDGTSADPFSPVEQPRGFEISAAGAGLQPWALFSIHEALRQTAANAEVPPVYFFDEPERHLHPTAQREAVEFIARIVAAGGNVVVATHAPAFLSTRIPNAEYVRVRREEGITQTDVIDHRVMATVESYATSLGLSRADLLQLTRAVLLVEGEHDRLVVEGFFGDELAKRFIRVLPLRGAHNALAILDAELLRQIGVPLYAMLDQTYEDQITALNEGRLKIGGGAEMRILSELALAKRGQGLPISFLPFPLPDIAWALPEEAVRKISPSFTTWQRVTKAFRAESKPTNPKDFLETIVGRRINASFIRNAVTVAREMMLEPHPDLTAAVALMTSTIDG